MADIGKPTRKIRIEPEPRPEPDEPKRSEPTQPAKGPSPSSSR